MGPYPPQEHIPIMSMSTIYKPADLILASDQRVVNSGDIPKISIDLAHTRLALWDNFIPVMSFGTIQQMDCNHINY